MNLLPQRRSVLGTASSIYLLIHRSGIMCNFDSPTVRAANTAWVTLPTFLAAGSRVATDASEAVIRSDKGAVSRSDQWVPFSAGYESFNTVEICIVLDPTITELDSYTRCVYFIVFQVR